MNQEELIEMIRYHVLVKKSDRKIIRTDGFTNAEYLFDFRNVILDQEYLPKLARMLAKLLEPYDDYQICGLESAAIPLVTALVMMTGKSGFYIRKSRKKTGLMNMIE
jgi:orotate phosphoribosyltransferase